MLKQLQFAIRPFSEHRRAEGLHNLLDSNILVGELVSRRAIFGGGGEGPQISMDASHSRQKRREAQEMRKTHQTRPNAPMPTGWRSEYLHEWDQLQRSSTLI